ncbi:MAG TPA: hypothetical protein VFF24_01135, partial [Acidimicrobiia bacterium]|nr:hypothetical protein [Acidimicrobiia bacterium]
MRRGPVVVGLALLLLGGALADRADRPDVPVLGTVGRAEMPTAPPASALSSTWYCAGGAGRGDSPYAAAVVVANPDDAPVKGTVTVVPEQGEPTTVPIEVKASGSTTVRLADVTPAEQAAALVDLGSGRAVVEHTITGPAGTASSPCASSASTRWYFADGATAKDATL